MRTELKHESDLRRNFLGVRWSDQEMDLVTKCAHERWLSNSAFIRQTVMDVLTAKKPEQKA